MEEEICYNCMHFIPNDIFPNVGKCKKYNAGMSSRAGMGCPNFKEIGDFKRESPKTRIATP
jgi:hypothetical protein